MNKTCHILYCILKGRAAERYPREDIKPLFRLMMYFTTECLSQYRWDSLHISPPKGLKAESQDWRMISETSFGSSQALPHLRGDPRHWEWIIQDEWSFEVQNRLQWQWGVWRSWWAQSIWTFQDKVWKSRCHVDQRCSNCVLAWMSWLWHYQLSLPTFHKKICLEGGIKS